MQYNINPNTYKNIFAVPTSLVDDNIRLAGVVQLKVILYLLRHVNDNNISDQSIADALGLDKFDVCDALVFWQERGLVIKGEVEEFSTHLQENVQNFSQNDSSLNYQTNSINNETLEISSVVREKEESKSLNQIKPNLEKIEKVEKKPVSSIPISRPSHQDVVNRLAESDELKDLFREAQEILGKTIGFDGQSVLMLMHDSYGLNVHVIMMLIQYCVEMGKSSFSNIAKMARVWAENEVYTVELAEEYITENGLLDEVWRKFIGLAGLKNSQPTTKQKQFMTSWVKEFNYDADMLYYAYEESIDHTGKMSLPYMDKIIRNWNKNGVKTPVDIQREKQKWLLKKEATYNKQGQNKPKQQPKKEVETSYDIDEYMKRSIGLKYVKNEES